MENKQIIITTSWDDGHALDTRIAELLDKYNIEGTFYVPIKNKEQPVMKTNTLREIANKFEIGGHTVNHIYLNTLGKTDAFYEISGCKKILQDMLSKKIDAFCYPGGKYSLRDIHLVKEAGFLFGRTTRLLHSSTKVQPFLFDTSIQVYNHSSITLMAHCLKNTFFVPIFQNSLFYKGDRNFLKMSEIIMNRILTSGGIFHLWGHSWEIEKYGLWNELEKVLQMLAFKKDIAYLNNSDCWRILSTNKQDSLKIL